VGSGLTIQLFLVLGCAGMCWNVRPDPGPRDPGLAPRPDPVMLARTLIETGTIQAGGLARNQPNRQLAHWRIPDG